MNLTQQRIRFSFVAPYLVFGDDRNSMENLTWSESPASEVLSGDAAESQGPSVEDFTNTFVISSDADRTLCEIPGNLAIDPFRQRRAHHKSKRGCIQCRKRRVKVSSATDDFLSSRGANPIDRLKQWPV